MIENQPLVSILIPLYNQERYFEKCIASVCNQTYKNLEIIVVNDGSTDKSPALLAKWAAKDNRIKVVNKPNAGLVNARRDGYREATGEFVAFLDSDDTLPLRAIEVLVNAIVANGVDLVIGSVIRKLGFFTWGNSKSFVSFPSNQVVSQPELFDKYFIGFFGKRCFLISMGERLFRKSAIDRALQETELFPDYIRFMGEDLNFNMLLFPYLRSMYRIDDLVYYYRYGGTVDHYNPHYPELFTLCQKRLELLDHYQYDDGYGPLYGEYVNMLYYHAQQILEFKQGNKDDVIAFFKQELATNSLIPRMMDYFTQHTADYEGITLILNNDYEGMYNHAVKLMHNRCDAWRYKMKRLVLGFLERIC